MKKLIVITMVLAIASVASAGLEWVTDLDQSTNTITATLVTDVAVKAMGITSSGIEADTTGTWALVSSAFTGAGTPFDMTNTKAGGYSATMAVGGDTTVIGDLLTLTFVVDDFDGEVVFTVPPFKPNPMISLYSTVTGADNAKMNIEGFTVVPEPMTMALLGLGGLFLRRRRA